MGNNLSGAEDNSSRRGKTLNKLWLSAAFSPGRPLTLSRVDSLAAAYARELIGFDLLSSESTSWGQGSALEHVHLSVPFWLLKFL